VLPRERVQIALEGGQPDRVPFLLECDHDYMAKAAGREPWEYIYADSLEQARIHEDFLDHVGTYIETVHRLGRYRPLRF